ncbi:ornithine cyclodeaminase family protein [Tautonia rosea]|uniref:ornithine cyclodeaminase family protein n=1 Tax=Tautonia rosea TaxID=2728037 RepID=UPI001475404E|nr:ornithine cyclodeaminase family protein [Tautonia rosea]
MLYLDAADVRRALPMPQAIEAMKRAFAALSDGSAVVPHRAVLPIPKNAGVSLVMSSYLDAADRAEQAIAVKVVSLFDGNSGRGLARVQATVLLIDSETGQLEAILDGAVLTAIRTAAASGAATDLLARPESRSLAILGAGVQARSHIEAICAVRPIETVAVYSPTPSKVEGLIREFAGRTDIAARFIAARSAAEAIEGADIICTTTTARTPVFKDDDIRPGTHLNAVGSYTPEAAEVPPETVARARVVVDSREAAWIEAGDLIQPLRSGRIEAGHIVAELGEIVLEQQPGRTSLEEITLFKSVGVAVQDASAARLAVDNARREGFGRQCSW